MLRTSWIFCTSSGVFSLHLHLAVEEENPLGRPLNVEHLLDCRLLEQAGKQVVALIVAMEMEVHVLMNGRELVGDGSVQQLNALFVHRRSSFWAMLRLRRGPSRPREADSIRGAPISAARGAGAPPRPDRGVRALLYSAA
jgi:hypothetical protein